MPNVRSNAFDAASDSVPDRLTCCTLGEDVACSLASRPLCCALRFPICYGTNAVRKKAVMWSRRRSSASWCQRVLVEQATEERGVGEVAE